MPIRSSAPGATALRYTDSVEHLREDAAELQLDEDEVRRLDEAAG
jgi:hypothetical protein